MGIEDYISDSGNSGNSTDDQSDSPHNSGAENDIEIIANKIKEHAIQKDLDVTLEDEQIRGNVDDLALIFAIMTLDFQEATIYDLIGENE